MAEVRKHAPPPAPPATYDLLGLTQTQAELIRDLLGSISLSDNHLTDHHSLFGVLNREIGLSKRKFRFHKNGGGWGEETQITTFRVRDANDRD